ncbi:MAG: hypothetical protein EXR55_06635, partial [Dehalococcoidia bacterium]|nr:hypothetical protein [Dehalococcoidia bacterium]
MNQRKVRSTIGIMGVLLLLLSLVTVMPVGAAVAGTVALDKAFINTTGTLTITLTDADLNAAVTQTNEATDFNGAAYSFPFTAGNDAGTQQQIRVKKFPILDLGTDVTVNFLDVTDSLLDLEVLAVSANDGLVTVRGKTGEATAAAAAYTLTYKAAEVQKTPSLAGSGAVRVTSSQDTTGFVIVLMETGPDTGIFKATFKTAAATVTTGADDADNATRPTIATVSGNIITVSYADASPAGTRSATVTVENNKPVATVVSPATGSATQNVNPKLTASFTDAEAGVDSTTITFVITAGGATVGAISTTTISGGFQAETTLSGLAAGETTVSWYAQATDKAGNVGRTDSNTTTVNDQDHSLRVDTVSPDFASPGATTGQWWDVAKTATDKTETSAILAKTTSIRLIFNESLDAASVSSGDFTVDGVPPAGAEVFSGAPASVFLTVPAMAADKRPAIVLVGAVSDKAGNSRASSAANPTATDGIAPTITVAVNPSLVKASANVTIEVGSNETLLTAPTILVNEIAQGSASLVGTNLFRLTFTNASAARYNVQVTAQDAAGNARTAGNADPAVTTAVLFQVDAALPAVTSTTPTT